MGLLVGSVGRLKRTTPILPPPLRSKGGFKALPPKAISWSDGVEPVVVLPEVGVPGNDAFTGSTTS